MGGNSQHRKYAERARKRERTPRSRNPDAAGHHRQHTGGGLDRFRQSRMEQMPPRLPLGAGKRLVNVYVEGYEDVAFWRGIFDAFEDERITFEIGVPPREDLAKGKKVILSMLPECSPQKLLCVDSDFDYLFGSDTEQAGSVTGSQFVFHTYAYATENFLCYAPSLHNVCVKATKNDARIFDFEEFLARYSQEIYPLFLWYAYSAQASSENVFTLNEFKSSVKLNYLDFDSNGADTLHWLHRQVAKRLKILEDNRPDWGRRLADFETSLSARGLLPENTYLYMQGHTLLDNVVMVLLNAVCEKLKLMSNIRISSSTKTGVALQNEMSNYNNSLRNVRDVLLDNEAYKDCPLYIMLQNDIKDYIKNYADS